MSFLRVNSITNATADGPVEFTNGLVIPTGKSLIAGSIDVDGSFTAESFSGNGYNLTNLVGTLEANQLVGTLFVV